MNKKVLFFLLFLFVIFLFSGIYGYLRNKDNQLVVQDYYINYNFNYIFHDKYIDINKETFTPVIKDNRIYFAVYGESCKEELNTTCNVMFMDECKNTQQHRCSGDTATFYDSCRNENYCEDRYKQYCDRNYICGLLPKKNENITATHLFSANIDMSDLRLIKSFKSVNKIIVNTVLDDGLVILADGVYKLYFSYNKVEKVMSKNDSIIEFNSVSYPTTNKNEFGVLTLESDNKYELYRYNTNNLQLINKVDFNVSNDLNNIKYYEENYYSLNNNTLYKNNETILKLEDDINVVDYFVLNGHIYIIIKNDKIIIEDYSDSNYLKLNTYETKFNINYFDIKNISNEYFIINKKLYKFNSNNEFEDLDVNVYTNIRSSVYNNKLVLLSSEETNNSLYLVVYDTVNSQVDSINNVVYYYIDSNKLYISEYIRNDKSYKLYTYKK